uniref:INSM transcriptional repressor 2 n=1 Tax=Oryzias latipes TaxID=8090 RepID=A0A3B3HT76_ORYLA
MPRGFLVKRNRRGAVFYRSHSQSTSERPGTTEEGALNEATRAEKPGLRGVESAESRKDSAGVSEAWSPHIESTLEAEAERRAQLPDTEEEVSVVDVLGLDGDLSCFYAPPPPNGVTLIESCSSVKPVSARLLEHQKHISFTGSCLTSSPVPEVPDLAFLSNPTPTAIPASIEKLLGDSSRPFTQPHGITDKYEISHMHVFPPLTLVTPEQQHAARKRSFLQEPHSKHHSKQGNPSKKPKINRKLNFEDEVTTSPVLGLRIKKESPEVRRQRETTSTPTAQPLGEFICQLCKEEYPDPFSLAQHKCSRIVRVEYRCPECDKVFSCPANLASHRRWHKPRPVISQGVETNRMRAADSPPSSLLLRNGDPHERADVLPPPSLTHPHLSNPPFIQALTEEEVYECRYCGKKFRRQAYLKKHLVTHEMSRPTSSYNQKVNGSQSQQVFLCHLCGARFPSVEIRDKHRLWHHQQIFTCKYCPSTFFSSPGLTRHINKTHPTENRQVMRLQMTVRP